MELCKTDIYNIIKLLEADADIIDKLAEANNTRAANKARLSRKLSKKLLSKISNDKK